MMLSPDGEFIPVGATPSDVEGFEIALGQPIPLVASEGLIDATRRGPWWLEFADQDGPAGLFPEISRPMMAAGYVIAAYTPIRWEGELVGALAISSRAPDAALWIEDRLPALEELGTFAGMLFGARAQLYGDVHVLRSRIREVIDARQFHVVMQPVIDLRTGAVVGHEALSRFDDGTSPHLRFGQAHGVGLGSELEGACARQALHEATHLPPGTWVSLNFSPASVVDGTAERTLAAADARPVVVEITEHLAIDSYPNLRGAISQISRARLAVDDAGAGFASLRHILELRPDYVKLDLELVRDIDSDPARQALTAGLRHFCSQSGMTLIAEGVETEAEAAMLLALGVDLAQGYFYGRPARVLELGGSAG
jgi:EAL domain-containing protein (putative c-di-GMP-specific phosphodiesterase class I)